MLRDVQPEPWIAGPSHRQLPQAHCGLVRHAGSRLVEFVEIQPRTPQ